ncbi:lysosomal alpha-mannosidase II isoform X1 [Oratosquilla oratoria]|uniref:lysosomal alpha-mannosidase II isoform X1 n=1 Tax=Oratosquilla oratoria TaxID=337810 RepID=UPI003F7684A9
METPAIASKYAFAIVMVLTLASAKRCPETKPDMLNVHLVCHTHDDVGWLKTVDQYYYGANNTIQRAGVQYILDSVVQELQRDPSRRFIYVESAFFFRWWRQQDEQTKAVVKSLVARGQLEFIGGGWCMNDEAAAHYNAIIDQMTLGLRMLNDTFGPEGRPTVAWQIDPFGHSSAQASLFAQMAFDGLFFGRLDFDDKNQRMKTKTMEMLWEASRSLGDEGTLFTGALPNGYGPPSGFCFDLLCNDEPIMDDPRLHDYNVDRKVREFLAAAREEAKFYRTNHIIMTMGMDFHYQSALSWLKNLGKLIKHVNEAQKKGSKVNIFYSTPSCYLEALYNSGSTFPTKSDDFFPYASDHHAYWTGYFTSRPALKGYIRMINNYMQAVKQVAALAGLGVRGRSELETLIEAMGVAQHHDAVSGTAKQHVTDDYNLRLNRGVVTGFQVLTQAYGKIQGTDVNEVEGSPKADTPVMCPLLNVSSCPTTEDAKSFITTIYNPLSKVVRFSPVRIPVRAGVAYKVTAYDGTAVDTQLSSIPHTVLDIPGRNSTAELELVFLAENIPPLGFVQYHVARTGNFRLLKSTSSKITKREPGKAFTVKSENLAVSIDKRGLLHSVGVVRPDDKITMYQVNQTFLYYKGMNGNNSKEDNRASGAYIFRPNGTTPVEVNADGAVVVTLTGPVVNEVRQYFSPWVSQVIRVYVKELVLEMEWLVGPIPIEDGVGKEVVSRVVWADLDTNSTFYTDANGREMQKRIKDFRNTWKLNNTEPVASNYYPVNSRLLLKSINDQGDAALLNDRSQGGTSLGRGHAELMVHRRLLHDDAFGVGEALNETAFDQGLIVRGKHYLIHSSFGKPGCDFGCMHRSKAEEVLLAPIVSFTPTTKSTHEWQMSSVTRWSGLSEALPDNVHLLTLEPIDDNTFLLRLEHMYEVNESDPYSNPVKVNLKGLFSDWQILSAKETTLGANMLKKDFHKLKWQVDPSDEGNSIDGQMPDHEGARKRLLKEVEDLVIQMNPMQIRTFLLTVKKIERL